MYKAETKAWPSNHLSSFSFPLSCVDQLTPVCTAVLKETYSFNSTDNLMLYEWTGKHMCIFSTGILYLTEQIIKIQCKLNTNAWLSILADAASFFFSLFQSYDIK